ncbi:hypothetical protein Ancab_007046 [Ancistrocladus abbreviatus]
MAGQNQGVPSMDQFDLYFRRADLDHDGRISGAEAVTFFQGSGLPKQVLAQVWMHADKNRTGFLNRQEFYNALKLVTVAQSKRELTPDIVNAALYGPASSKIPAPQINIPSSPMPPPATSLAASPAGQMGAVTPAASQNLGPRGQLPPNANMSQQYFQAQGNQMMRPSQVMPANSAPGPQVMPSNPASRPPQVMPLGPAVNPSQGVSSLTNLGVSANLVSGNTGGAPPGPTSLAPNAGMSPSITSVSPKTQDLLLTSSQPAVKDTKASSVSGNGFASDSVFGGEAFASIQSLPKQDPSSVTSSATVPVSAAPQSSPVQNSLDSLQNAFTKQHMSSQPQQVQTSLNRTHAVSPATSSNVSTGLSAGNSMSNQSLPPWPKMTLPGIQKYTKVFMEVDTDRDGKITGEQARNLFLSWRLPREVLKQVWDLADQDNDSMLSVREFCIALYLMERYREGRALPAALPNSVLFDEILMRMTGLPNSSHGNAAWGSTSGFGQMQGITGAQPMTPGVGLQPPVRGLTPHSDGKMQFNQQKFGEAVPNNVQTNQRSDVEQNSVQENPSEATDGEQKVEKVEKIILDSKEKLEFYRTKMQELVLYKSKCDNRLNEIIERASADKREADLLAKKYEERYKQVAEIHSRLTIEEATFREYQERKMELRQAIINMEHGGSADGILQVRADRIQSDLEELLKALSERCKKHGLEFKTMALIELPTGWQPGIQEGAAVWDEDWDKFEDEGLIFDKTIASSDPKSTLFQSEPFFQDDGFSPDSMSNADGKSERQFNKGEHVLDNESGYAHSEDDSARSPPGSPAQRTAGESPSREFSDIFTKDSDADTDFHRSFDGHGWGTFDVNEDAESVWGFNTSSKDSVHEQQGDKLFESSDFGLRPVRTESPQAESSYNKRSLFADSVPGTPFSKSGNSPRYSEAGDNNFFDNYSRFDSFSMHDNRFSPPRETFARFDSTNSSRGEAFGRFDSMNSSRGEPFARFDSMSSSRGEVFSRFDSMSSSRGFDHSRGFSFDDADPFGSSGPFKVSTESQTPKKGSESWSSF